MHLCTTACHWHRRASVGASDCEKERPAVSSSHFADLNGSSAMAFGFVTPMGTPFRAKKKPSGGGLDTLIRLRPSADRTLGKDFADILGVFVHIEEDSLVIERGEV